MAIDLATETARIEAAQRQLEHSVRAYQLSGNGRPALSPVERL